MPANAAKSRQLFDVDLAPAAGSRFQPTGFPDLGAARFDRPVRDNGTLRWAPSLLVESAQSMANWLESVGWDEGAQHPVPELAGLPYVRVVAETDGRYLTSSRTEAHRLASAFVKDSKLADREMREVLKEKLGLRDDTPLAPRDIAAAVARLDPLCLLHGVFFAESAKVWPGQPKIARAVTAFIEAIDVQEAISGGVKRDEVRHATGGEVGGSAEGYGFVPYHRTEFTADRIVASFSIDLAQLHSYGLPDPAAELLATLARWEIRSLLDRGLRLRTACDLAPLDGRIADREGEELPPAGDLATQLRRLVNECAAILGDGKPLEVRWSDRPKKAVASRHAAAEGDPE